jgi:hypothetical protein
MHDHNYPYNVLDLNFWLPRCLEMMKCKVHERHEFPLPHKETKDKNLGVLKQFWKVL